jgi:DNA-binding transcriptional MerR regulator
MTEDAGVLENNRQKTATKDTQKQNYSLVEVAQKTGIPMPILLRYKREHPDRVPSIGSGSQQRFPEEAIEVLTQIHQEATGREEEPRRGGFGLLSLPRLRKQVRRPDEDEEEEEAAEAKPAKRGRASTGAATGEGMTLVEVSEKLDIPYPTVARYASQHGDRIPHHGSGRSRRFPEAALEVFEQIRKESKPGRPPKKKAKAKREAAAGSAGRATPAPTAYASVATTQSLERLARRIESLERSQKMLEDQIRDLLDDLARPAKATVEV